MHSTKSDEQQWSIRAEFTVSPHGVCVPEKKCVTNTIQDKSGIRLSYCWKSNENANAVTSHLQPVRNLCKPVQYQKGDLTFTSTPPCRLCTTACGNNFEYHDSGYGSDLLSLNSIASGISQSPNNRKCRSTCSIVLCSNACNSAEEISTMPRQTKYEKNYNLSHQTSAVQNKRHNTNCFNRGDQCYHCNSAKSKKLSGDQLLCNTESQHPTGLLPLIKDQIIESTDYKPYKRDVSIQTSDSLQKCSTTTFESGQKTKLRKSEKTHSNNRKSYKRGQYNLSSTRASGEKLQTSSFAKPNLAKNLEAVGHTSDSSKKSRTIHIDVYCTDTDMELSETSTDSWDNESASTPQTVFESRNVSVTHERAKDNGLPYKIKRHYRKNLSNLSSIEMDDSDIDDESSTSYPSKMDSYSTLNDFSSSISSIKSWKSHSLLSCTNECDPSKNFNRTGTLPISGKPALYKLNTERKCIPGGIRTKNVLNERNVYRSNQEKVGDKLQNICLERNALQTYGKHTLKQQSPFDKSLILNTSPVKNDIKENALNSNNKKHFEASQNGVAPQKLSESNACIKNVEDMSYGKLVINDTTSRPVLPEQYTEQIASRFGQVINIFKKPGRHKGPTKNSDCCCDYCRRYFM